MTWTKLGDEFPAEARELSDAAFRTHVEALMWSNSRLLDLRIPKGDLKRFAETLAVDLAVAELVRSGWWKDRGAFWDVGRKHPEWQPSRKFLQASRAAAAVRARRYRANKKHNNYPTRPDPDAHRDTTRDVTRDDQSSDLSFHKFWDAYPRKVGMQKAREIWRDASVTVDAQELIESAARFASSLNGVPRRRVVWPARWLSERWWLDYPPEHKAGPSTENRA